ncbi:hypothetical protein [Xinzhou nematode virus 6]|uniref:Uncharacterized protein n=1 Tax=Xinzhou nematode virus 6 TaxID=1923774 RepID=A0A1L3KIW9_9NIDO|nr:hypothetical protein [Xinzhou nematode virus 6]APG77347.1 hypothetical protein [Xinzhou nematode virus 6]
MKFLIAIVSVLALASANTTETTPSDEPTTTEATDTTAMQTTTKAMTTTESTAKTTQKQCEVCPQYDFKFQLLDCRCNGTLLCQIELRDEPQLEKSNFTVLTGLYVFVNETYIQWFSSINIMYTNHTGRLPGLDPDCVENENITLAVAQSKIYTQPIAGGCQLNTPGNFYQYNGTKPKPTREVLKFCNATVLNTYVPIVTKDNSDQIVKYVYREIAYDLKCNDKTKLSFHDYEIAVYILLAVLAGFTFATILAPRVLKTNKKEKQQWHPY